MVEFLAPVLRKCVENGILIVGNFGSASPLNAARRLHALAREQGVRGLRVAVVDGDDLRDRIRNLQASAWEEERPDRKSTRLNSSHLCASRMPSSACKKKHI